MGSCTQPRRVAARSTGVGDDRLRTRGEDTTAPPAGSCRADHPRSSSAPTQDLPRSRGENRIAESPRACATGPLPLERGEPTRSGWSHQARDHPPFAQGTGRYSRRGRLWMIPLVRGISLTGRPGTPLTPCDCQQDLAFPSFEQAVRSDCGTSRCCRGRSVGLETRAATRLPSRPVPAAPASLPRPESSPVSTR